MTCKKLYLAGVDIALEEERAEAARVRAALVAGSAAGGGTEEGGGAAAGGGRDVDGGLSVLEILVRHARKDILTESQVLLLDCQ